MDEWVSRTCQGVRIRIFGVRVAHAKDGCGLTGYPNLEKHVLVNLVVVGTHFTFLLIVVEWLKSPLNGQNSVFGSPSSVNLGVASISVLFRDPNLSRKPQKTPGKWIRFFLNRETRKQRFPRGIPEQTRGLTNNRYAS